MLAFAQVGSVIAPTWRGFCSSKDVSDRVAVRFICREHKAGVAPVWYSMRCCQIFRVCGTYSSAACSPGTDLVVNADALEFWIRGCIGTYHMCSVSLSLGRGCSGNSLRKQLLSQLSTILPSFPIPNP